MTKISFIEYNYEFFIFNTFIRTLYKKGRFLIIDECKFDLQAYLYQSITSYNIIIQKSLIKTYMDIFHYIQFECDFKEMDDKVIRILNNNTIYGAQTWYFLSTFSMNQDLNFIFTNNKIYDYRSYAANFNAVSVRIGKCLFNTSKEMIFENNTIYNQRPEEYD